MQYWQGTTYFSEFYEHFFIIIIMYILSCICYLRFCSLKRHARTLVSAKFHQNRFRLNRVKTIKIKVWRLDFSVHFLVCPNELPTVIRHQIEVGCMLFDINLIYLNLSYLDQAVELSRLLADGEAQSKPARPRPQGVRV